MHFIVLKVCQRKERSLVAKMSERRSCKVFSLSSFTCGAFKVSDFYHQRSLLVVLRTFSDTRVDRARYNEWHQWTNIKTYKEERIHTAVHYVYDPLCTKFNLTSMFRSCRRAVWEVPFLVKSVLCIGNVFNWACWNNMLHSNAFFQWTFNQHHKVPFRSKNVLKFKSITYFIGGFE